MGYMRHHALVVTASSQQLASEARHAAVMEFELGGLITSMVQTRDNDYFSFAVLPDGSKEGWPESDMADRQRAAFKEWLREHYHEDGSTPIAWAEVQYGDEMHETTVTESSDHDYSAMPPGSYKLARGVLPHDPNGETPEARIRRARG